MKLSAASLIVSVCYITSAFADSQDDEAARCYDAAFVGYIQSSTNEINLGDLLPRKPNTIYFGFRSDLLVRVQTVLGGSNLPHFVRTRTILTGMIIPIVPVVFFVRHWNKIPFQTIGIYISPHDSVGNFIAPSAVTPEIIQAAGVSGLCGK